MRFSLSLSMISRREGTMSQELTPPLAAFCGTEQVYAALRCMMGTSRPPFLQVFLYQGACFLL